MIGTSVTIASGATTSTAIDTRDPNVNLVGLLFPTLVTATTFTLTGSIDGTNFYPIIESDGSAIEYTLLASGDCFSPISEVHTKGLMFLKVVLAGATDAERTIRPILQRAMYP